MIALRPQQLGCKVFGPDELFGLFVDCPEGRIVFGPEVRACRGLVTATLPDAAATRP